MKTLQLAIPMPNKNVGDVLIVNKNTYTWESTGKELPKDYFDEKYFKPYTDPLFKVGAEVFVLDSKDSRYKSEIFEIKKIHSNTTSTGVKYVVEPKNKKSPLLMRGDVVKSENDLINFTYYWFISSSGEVQKAINFNGNENQMELEHIDKAQKAFNFRMKVNNVYSDNYSAQEALERIG